MVAAGCFRRYDPGIFPDFCGIETTTFLAWGDLPLALLLGALSLLVCCGTGLSLHLLLRRRGFPVFGFEHALSGLILLVSGFAIWTTRGLTLLLPVPLLLTGAVYMNRSREHPARGEWLAGILGLGGFLLFYAQAFSPDSTFLKYPSGDLSYYARLADHLLLGGQENRLVDIPAPEVPVAQLYHWGDTWSLAMLTRIWNIRGIYALPLVLFPVLAALFSMGLYRLLKPTGKLAALTGAPFAILLLFTPPVALLPAAWIQEFHLLPVPAAQYPKLLMYGVFLCALLIRLRTASYPAAAWMLASAGLFHAPMLPAGVVGLIVIALIGWRRRNAAAATVLHAAGALTSLLCWPALLYLVISGPLPFYTADGRSTAFRLHPGLILPALANIALLWPYALLLLLVRRQGGPFSAETGRILRSLAVFGAAGLGGWLLSADLTADGAQFFTAMIPLAAIVVTVICFQTAARRRRFLSAGLCCILPLAGLIFNRGFSTHTYLTDRISQADYRNLKTIPAVSRPWDSLKAVVIKSPLEPDRLATRFSVVFYPLEFLVFEHPRYEAASLQAPFLANVPPGVGAVDESARMKWHTPVMQFVYARGLSAVPPELQAFWYVDKVRPDVLIIANDAAIPNALLPLLGADSIQLRSKPYRVLPLYYSR